MTRRGDVVSVAADVAADGFPEGFLGGEGVRDVFQGD